MSEAYWTTSKRIGKCGECKADIEIGDRIVWSPKEYKAYCMECGTEVAGDDPKVG